MVVAEVRYASFQVLLWYMSTEVPAVVQITVTSQVSCFTDLVRL